MAISKERRKKYLPSEVVTNIFARLPLETLGSVMLVNKFCLKLISAPAFATAHLTNSKQGGVVKVHGASSGVPRSYLSPEPANKIQYGSGEAFPAVSSGDHTLGKSATGKTSDHGGPSTVAHSNKGGVLSNVPDASMLITQAPGDTGKSPASQGSSTSLPFKEQQLKQLHTQILVFSAFRNGMMPKKLHLEIALGNIIVKKMDLTEI